MRRIDDIKSLDILEILPHRRPFVLIDRLVYYNEETTAVKTEFEVKSGGVFVSEGRLAAEGIMENIAQSCAARIGFYDWLHNLPVRPGVIGSVKDFKVEFLPRIGQTLVTSITPKAEVLGVLLAEARVVADGNVVAEGIIKVAV